MNPLPYDTPALLQDVYQHRTEDIVDYKNRIKQFVGHHNETVTLNDLYKRFGYSQHVLISLAVHFLVVDDGWVCKSPYASDAPDDAKEHTIK